jgi:hypothetical protein
MMSGLRGAMVLDESRRSERRGARLSDETAPAAEEFRQGCQKRAAIRWRREGHAQSGLPIGSAQITIHAAPGG